MHQVRPVRPVLPGRVHRAEQGRALRSGHVLLQGVRYLLPGMLAQGNHDGRGGGMMGTRIGIEVSIAVADAVKLANPDVVAAYPITPQTHIVEHLAELVANRELDAGYIPVESEHSAMSACLGSAAAGARTLPATPPQGQALMNEVLWVASGMRLPIVMAVANRALSAPLSIWGDHSDVMSVRDTGWIQIFVENGQQAV